MKKISVIIPVYNVHKYLEQCVDSIINQTLQPYEIILVDDGSTDGSELICNNYDLKYDFIKVIHKENAGLGLARNTGMEMATGQFIVFIDSDDFADITLLEDLYSAHIINNSDTCLGGYKRVDPENQVVGKFGYKSQCYKAEQVLKDLLPRMIGSSPSSSDSIAMSAWNVLYSMEIIKENNIRFVSERVLISEDIIFNLKYYRYAKNVSLIESCNYNYRVNPGTLTTKYRENRFDLVKKLYNVEAEMLKDIGIYDISQYRLMRQFFNYLRMCFAQEHPEISEKKFLKILKSIRYICKDSLVQKVIQIYPKSQLGLKQKIFLHVVRFKCSLIIYLFIRSRIISVG